MNELTLRQSLRSLLRAHPLHVKRATAPPDSSRDASASERRGNVLGADSTRLALQRQLYCNLYRGPINNFLLSVQRSLNSLSATTPHTTARCSRTGRPAFCSPCQRAQRQASRNPHEHTER